MHQDATWYGCRPQPRGLCVRWGPTPHQKGGGPHKNNSAYVSCGQTAGWIKTVLGMGVGLCPGDFVLDGHQAPSPKGGAEPPPQFSANFYCAQTAGCITMLLGMQVGLSPGTLCSMGTQPPLSRKGAKPPPNFRPMSIVAKRLDGSRWNLTRRWALVQATLC